jgi:hypothetical protein
MKMSLNLCSLAKTKTNSVMLFSIMLLAPFVYGQSTVRPVNYNAQVKFIAGGKSFPIGAYKILYEPKSKYITLRAASGAVTQLTIITRLASETPTDRSRLVFDMVGNERRLSEIWIPGEDGFLVGSTKEEHKHEIQKDLQ